MEMDKNDQPTYEEWLKRVDKLLDTFMGLKSADLSDAMWKDWYDERIRPIHAANRGLAYTDGRDAADGDEDDEDDEDNEDHESEE
jgi:hypothetical protein